VFANHHSAWTVYYLPGATGWKSTFDGVPTATWNPRVMTLSADGGPFGFDITGHGNAIIVVEGCTNLADPVWVPVSTNTLASDGTSSFKDPQGMSHPARFYRLRSP